MRHLELPLVRLDEDDIKTECDIEIKDEDLEDLDIKDELIGLGAFDEALQSVVDFHSYDRKDLIDARSNTEDELMACDEDEAAGGDEGKDDVDYAEQRTSEEWKSLWGIKCGCCGLTWTSRATFERHYVVAHGAVGGTGAAPLYTCSYCDKTTAKYSTFRSHCYRHAMEGRHRCAECGKGFSQRSMLTTHLQAKHARGKPYMCEQCGRAFATRGGLRAHQQRGHGSGATDGTEQQQLHPCEECGRVLRTRGGLTAHLAVHRLGRRFMCDLCGKTFTQKVNMQQHVRQHGGERPWHCEQCPKAFAERSHLARHRQFHTNERPWHCDTCGGTYKTERCLKVHRLVHAEQRPHQCRTCGKAFLSTTKLRQHVNVHTGERPYKCRHCPRTFTNYPNWLKHTKRRHSLLPPAAGAAETQPPQTTLPPFSLHFNN